MTFIDPEHQKLYNRLYNKGNKILFKLAQEVAKNGYRENLGQNEARGFDGLVFNSGLHYREAAQLSTEFNEGVDNL